MSPRSALVVFVAALMVCTALSVALGAALPTRGGSPTASPAVVHPSVTTLSYVVLNGYRLHAATFYPGAVGSGTLYFIVADSTTTDKQVNITLTDPNATRDGIPTPAFHYVATLNSTTHSFDSYTADVGYSFPASIPYSGGWTLNFSESATNYVDVEVIVDVYYVNLATSVYGSTLPGQPYEVFWNLTSASNGASFYTHATNVFITGTYYGNGTYQPLFAHPHNVPLTGAAAGLGVFKGVVPDNATPLDHLYFTVYAYANVSGVTVENASADTSIAIGEPDLMGVGLTEAPPVCDLFTSASFGTGTTLAGCIEVGSWFGSATPIPGLPVTVGYWNGTATVTPAGAPTSLTTNASGEAAFTFVADSPPFTVSTHTYVYNAINYTVHIPNADSAGYHWTLYSNRTWLLVPPAPEFGYVNVTLDKTQYFVGQTATVTWAIHSSDANLTGPIDPVAWTLFTGTGTLNITALSGTAQSGTFTVAVTSAMIASGYFGVALTAANATASFVGTAYAYVLAPELLLTPAESYYTAGSTVPVTATLEGATGATISYLVVGVWFGGGEANVTSGTVANGSSFSIPIPSSHPPQALYVYGWATLGGVAFGTTEVELDLAYGYSIQLGVSTPSSYSDGSYQPGQTVTLTYAIVPVDGAPEPAIVSFEIVALGFPTIHEVQNVGPSGTVSFTIPSNAPRGTLIVEMEVETALFGECLPVSECMGIAALPINPSPSVLSMEIGAGSGVTVGWLIVLVLVLLVGAVGAVLFLRGRASRRRGGSGSGQGASPPPEWKGSSGSGSGTSGGAPPAAPPPGTG